MSSSRRAVSKRKAHKTANRKVRRAANKITEFAAIRDSMRSGRRLYGCGLAA